MSGLRDLMEGIGTAIDAAGVIVILLGALLATRRFVSNTRLRRENSYQHYRQDLGKAILLGLEFLIAGDIIRTVAVSPTIHNMLVLGLIVLIRTFLSVALQLEIEGRWPWQQQKPGSVTPS